MFIFTVRAVGKIYYNVKYRNKKIDLRDVRMYCFDFKMLGALALLIAVN